MKEKYNVEELNKIIIPNNTLTLTLSLTLSLDEMNGEYGAENNQLEKLEEYYKNLKDNYDILEKKNKLEKQLKSIHHVVNHFTLTDLQEAIHLETTYHANDCLFKQLELSHSMEDVEDYISYWQNVLEAQERLGMEKKLNELTTQYNALPINNIDYTQYDTSALQSQMDELVLLQGTLQHQLQHLEESKLAMPCPYCQKEVLYKKGQLMIMSTESGDDINIVTKKI